MAYVEKSNDKRYPIEISDSWSYNKVFLDVDQAKELIKDLKKVIKIIEEAP